MADLNKARKTINAIDKEMARLFEERMRAAEEVAEYKREHGLSILDSQREAEIIRKNSELIEDDTVREYYIRFLKGNMELSRAYQTRLNEGMTVAYCGTEGAFAQIAATRTFPYARTVAYPSFEAAYAAVVAGECDVAMLPIENSLNGEVGQVTDLMFSGELYINNVVEYEITHDLLGKPGAKVEDIRTVVSHAQALGQCRKYITEKGLSEVEYANTALAAEYVAGQDDMSVAAIASEEAAKRFELVVLEKALNDNSLNTTRFAVFSRAKRHHLSQEMGVHTILLFTVRNEAGALAGAIDIIGKHGFNMRTLRSRPMKTLLWQYYFYVEAEGNINTDEGKAMLEELGAQCDRLKAVGTYTKPCEV